MEFFQAVLIDCVLCHDIFLKLSLIFQDLCVLVGSFCSGRLGWYEITAGPAVRAWNRSSMLVSNI